MKFWKITTIATIATIVLSILSSCSKDKVNSGNGNRTTTVKVNTLSYEGDGLVIPGENEISDMQACLFKDGVMTHVFDGLSSSDGSYSLKLENMTGKLYMIANLGGKIDLNSMLSSGITEADFMKTAVGMGTDGKAVNFFTGTVEFNRPGQYSYTADLKRGVARFDLAVSTREQEVAVKKVEITNLAQKGFLVTPSDGIATPDMAGTSNAVITFDEPVTDKSQGILYAYEQKNSDIQINVTVEIAGVEKILTKSFSGDISRNNVYAVQVNKNDIDIYVNVNISDWEDGPDTEIEA